MLWNQRLGCSCSYSTTTNSAIITPLSLSLLQVTKWRGQAEGWILAANSRYAHATFSILIASSSLLYSFHSVKAVWKSHFACPVKPGLIPIGCRVAKRWTKVSKSAVGVQLLMIYYIKKRVTWALDGYLDEDKLALSVPYYWTQHRHTLPSCHAACRSAPSAIASHS